MKQLVVLNEPVVSFDCDGWFFEFPFAIFNGNNIIEYRDYYNRRVKVVIDDYASLDNSARFVPRSGIDKHFLSNAAKYLAKKWYEEDEGEGDTLEEYIEMAYQNLHEPLADYDRGFLIEHIKQYEDMVLDDLPQAPIIYNNYDEQPNQVS